MRQPKILIGMPAFRGADLIRESLESIAAQDHKEFRVIISVDNQDAETAAACEPALADPRFSLIVQDKHLGWAGNINWLMSQPGYDFFCYWQHDDYTSSNYISELLKASTTHPSAVCYFSGIQWFGKHSEWMGSASVTGLGANRAFSIFESLNGIPLRALVRRDAIDRIGPIRTNRYDSAFEEYVWVAKLAGLGNLHYVEEPVYFKRARDDSVHAKWHNRDRLWRRAVWLEFGLGMLETIWPLVCPSDRLAVLCAVLDRLCVPKPGRFLFYDGPHAQFASDFVSKALGRFPVPIVERAIADDRASPFLGEFAGELLDQAILLLRSRPSSPEHVDVFRFSAGDPGIDLLLDGWSFAEPWGTWSVGHHAGLRLPLGSKKGRWKALVTFRAYGGDGMVRVKITVAEHPGETTWQVPARQDVTKELSVECRGDDILLRLAFPEARSPASLGENEDRRELGIGLISLQLKPD